MPSPAYESPSRESKSSTIQHMCLQHTNEKDIGVWRKQHTSRSHLNGHYGFVRQSRVRFNTAVRGIEGGTVTDLQGSSYASSRGNRSSKQRWQVKPSQRYTDSALVSENSRSQSQISSPDVDLIGVRRG